MIDRMPQSGRAGYPSTDVADPSGFEPESEAPEAPMLSKLYYESLWNFEV